MFYFGHCWLFRLMQPFTNLCYFFLRSPCNTKFVVALPGQRDGLPMTPVHGVKLLQHVLTMLKENVC